MMTAEQLKNSILQLAMQGKLVEQRPEEGTGEDLYKTILAEKKKLVKDGSIKAGKKYNAISEEEIMFDIPETWVWSRLSDIVFNRGQKKPENAFSYIDIGSIDNVHQKLNDEENIIEAENAPSRARKIVAIGDVIYSTVRPYLHNMCIIDREFSHEPIASTGFAAMTCHEGLYNRFLFYYLLSPGFDRYANDTENSKGVAYPAINDQKLYKALVPLPPLAEQKRIVAKIEELMPFVEQYAATSTKLNTLNASFSEMMKKSILQEAVQGKLVSQDPNDEPASALLKKIAGEKKRLIKEGKIKKENELPPITDTEIPFDIPESWEWARLGSLITVRGGKRLPVGKQLITEKTEHVYIRVTDMKNETVDMMDLHYLTEDVYKLISSYIIKKEDIFIVIVGSTIGKAGIIPDELDGMNLTENAARLTPYFVDKRFLLKMITSDFMQAQFVDRTHQVGQPKLALFRLKEAIIPIPPLNEQKRIVERLERFEPEILSLKNNLFR